VWPSRRRPFSVNGRDASPVSLEKPEIGCYWNPFDAQFKKYYFRCCPGERFSAGLFIAETTIQSMFNEKYRVHLGYAPALLPACNVYTTTWPDDRYIIMEFSRDFTDGFETTWRQTVSALYAAYTPITVIECLSDQDCHLRIRGTNMTET